MDSRDARSKADLKAPPAYVAGHHWVGPLNFDPEVQQSYSFPEPLTIFDSTLRKILYTSGIRPSVDDLLHVSEALEEVGVREIFFNVHWFGEETPDKRKYEVCRAVLARGFAFHMTVCSDSFRASPSDDSDRPPVSTEQAIDALREVGMDTMAVSVGVPKDQSSRERQSSRLAEVISYAHSLGVSSVLALNDVGRVDFDELVDLSNEGIRLGAKRVDLSDSYSSLSPEATRLFVRRFKAGLVAPVGVTMHTHDDFGLGSAAAIAAATGGAHPDVSVNGVSYRSGFAVLEEVALSLELLYGVRTGIRLDRLQHLSEVVAERTGMANHPLKPITGAHQFLRDRPAWMLPYLKDGAEGFPPAGSCVAPSVVGGRMRMVWGNNHAKPVVRAKLRQMGLAATEEQVQEIRRRLESRVEALDAYPRWLTEEEVEAICREVVR